MHCQLKNISPHNLVFLSRPKMANPMKWVKNEKIVFSRIPNPSQKKTHPCLFFFVRNLGKDRSPQNLLAQVISSDPRGKPFRSSPATWKEQNSCPGIRKVAGKLPVAHGTTIIVSYDDPLPWLLAAQLSIFSWRRATTRVWSTTSTKCILGGKVEKTNQTLSGFWLWTWF